MAQRRLMPRDGNPGQPQRSPGAGRGERFDRKTAVGAGLGLGMRWGPGLESGGASLCNNLCCPWEYYTSRCLEVSQFEATQLACCSSHAKEQRQLCSRWWSWEGQVDASSRTVGHSWPWLDGAATAAAAVCHSGSISCWAWWRSWAGCAAKDSVCGVHATRRPRYAVHVLLTTSRPHSQDG